MRVVEKRFEAGPLDATLQEFGRQLRDQGYRATTIEQYLAIGYKFGHHLVRKQVAVACLQETHVEDFLIEATAGRKLRDRGDLTRRFWRKPLRMLLAQLREAGVVPAAKLVQVDPTPGLDEYLVFLREHRGLSHRTLDRQRRHVTWFLAHVAARTEDDLRRISVEQLDQFLVEVAHRLARESIGSVCASMRGFVAYLHMRGFLASDIREQVMTPHIYPLEKLPRAIEWQEVERILAAIDRGDPMGCRDYAILALLAYCGLRAGEVAGLDLGDLAWRHDVIHLHRPKGRTTEDIPLVPAVGEALIAYLRQRPTGSKHAAVFLTFKAPIGPLGGWRVSGIAGKYLRRAGVKTSRLGAHTLRHSFAVHLLRQGFPLKTIGDALGHQHPQSTFIYAKAALEDLREVALEISGVQS